MISRKIKKTRSQKSELISVCNCLQRFVNDFFDGRECELPTAVSTYKEFLKQISETGSAKKRREYPSPRAVLRHFDNMVKAWFAIGYIVEVKSKKRRYAITPEIDEMLCRIYDYKFRGDARPAGVPAGPSEYAEICGIPKYSLCKRAAELGLTAVKESNWSKEELSLLDRYGYMSPARIVIKLKEQGFRRTETGVRLLRKRRMSHKASPFYSVNALAKLFGADAHKVSGWVNKGLLEFELKGSREKGDTKLIRRDSIYRFIVGYPNEINLVTVDKLWFLHIVTKGEVSLDFSDSRRTGSKRNVPSPAQPREHRKQGSAEAG